MMMQEHNLWYCSVTEMTITIRTIIYTSSTNFFKNVFFFFLSDFFFKEMAVGRSLTILFLCNCLSKVAQYHF